ncbi:hypothetical protein ACSBR2_000444 [Camellia fascicularis]
MPSLRNFFSSSSSSSASSSPCDSPLKQGFNDSNFFKKSGSKRRLTRQRKLRHATDAMLGLFSTDQSRSLPVSPNSGSRSPTNSGNRSSLAVPQPLPLPELNTLVKQNDQSNSQSPKVGPSRAEGDGRDGTGGSNPPSSPTRSYFSHQSVRNTTDHSATKSSKSHAYRRRGFPKDLNVESVPHNFTLNVPTRSAPTSVFSSPVPSPQRFSSVDLFHSSLLIPQEFRVSSAVEGPVSSHSPSQMFSPRLSCTPDHSPLHSPKLQKASQNTRNAGVSFHSHHKSLPESSAGWPEGSIHANLHPLPLPPGGLKPSQSTTTHNIMERQDVSTIKSKWIKGKLIGRGTYGSVYEAINSETGAMCAMKEVDVIGDDPKSSECVKQLEQEIKVLQHLKHPNIVRYYGCEVLEERFCIYLQYVHPGSINKYVRDHCGAVTECVVRNFTRHILLGLAYLHSTKTIHRDIKGANLLVDSSGVVKLADFGLAKHLSGCTIDLSLKGSPHWMAPEVLQAVMRKDSNSQLAYAVDIWSLGCTVIEMLNGRPPWSEFNGVQAMFSVLNKSPPIPETLSLEGKDFLRLCFQRNPADRPSAARLLEHSFLQSSHDQDVLGCTRELFGMKLMDTSHSPRDGTKNLKGSSPISPGAWMRQLPCNGSHFGSPPSAFGPNNLHLAPGNNSQHTSPRAHRREIPHL